MAAALPPAEVDVDAGLVRRLLAAQHPDLAGLRLARAGTGWDNEVYRLGTDLAVRLPRRQLGAQLIGAELRWLPGLAAGLPLSVPTPVRAGRPGCGYPWRWSVCRWVPGRPLGAGRLSGGPGLRAAADLAGFLAALHRPAPADAPANPYRGVPLAQRSASLHAALAAVPTRMAGPVAAAWQQAATTEGHSGAPTWVHGDLHGLNVLVRRDRICGVLDFGDLCAGDPATDLAAGWLLLDAAARAELRARLGCSAARWQRGRGWALLLAVMFLAHDSATNRAIGLGTIGEVLADVP